jgi:MYXO-CTERM domain-containing protein
VQREIMSVPGRYHPSNFPVEASMTVRRSIIAMSGAALLLCTSGALNAQQAPPAEKETTVVPDDEDRDWGWIGLLGLLGLAGLFGGRDRFVGLVLAPGRLQVPAAWSVMRSARHNCLSNRFDALSCV